MNLLQPYIKRLLSENDCVIIPGFGAFIAREIPAHYDRSTATFMPPGKALSFNVLLKEDDGLLVNQVAVDLNIKYSKAKHFVSEQVEVANQVLAKERLLNIAFIGCLSYNAEGLMEFDPLTMSYENLKLYGLQQELKIKELSREIVPEKHISPMLTINTPPVKNNIIKIAAASVAAAIIIGLFIFMPSSDVENGHNQAAIGISQPKHETAQVESDMMDTPDATEDVEMMADNMSSGESQDAEVELNQPIKVEVGESESMESFNEKYADEPSSHAIRKTTSETTSDDAYTGDADRYYHVVIGSVASNTLAMNIVNKFNASGVKASSLDCGDRYRIVNKSFTDKSEAVSYLRDFKMDNPQFSDAWIFVERLD